MADRARMKAGWDRMKSGTVMSRYTSAKTGSPAEVAKLDTWLADPSQPLPVLASAFGSGLVDLLGGALAPAPAPVGSGSLGAIFLDRKELPLVGLHHLDFLGLESWMRDNVDVAKLRSSATKVYGYLETAGYADSDLPPHPSALPATLIDPAWRLGPMFWNGSKHLLDMGNQAYQDAWAAWAIKDMAGVFDGVLMDDVNTWENFHGAWPSLSISAAAWNAKVESFLARVCPQLHAAGLATIANVGSEWNDDQAMLVRWAKLVGGYHREHWLKWENDPTVFNQPGWVWQTGLQRAVLAAGVPFYASTHGTLDLASAMVFCRASYLLFHDPRVGGAYAWLSWVGQEGGKDGGKDPWSPAWAVELGAPVGVAVESGSKWTREFQGGSVSVDPVAGSATLG